MPKQTNNIYEKKVAKNFVLLLGSNLDMRKEPEYSDFIYEEIRECEEYALMNMITFEAAIRNPRVKEILSILDSTVADRQMDSMMKPYDTIGSFRKELSEDYYLNYFDYKEYKRIREPFLYNNTSPKQADSEYQKLLDEISIENTISSNKKLSTKELVQKYKKTYIIHFKNNEDNEHRHSLELPLYRPKMDIPQKNSSVKIEIPMYHIHPKDIKAYYERLSEKHEELLKEAQTYYKIEELFFDETEEKKSKSEVYSRRFFVWDYVQWWLEKYGTYTPDKTAGSLYYKIGLKVGLEPHPDTGRNPTIENDLTNIKKLIEGGYKRFYKPKIKF